VSNTADGKLPSRVAHLTKYPDEMAEEPPPLARGARARGGVLTSRSPTSRTTASAEDALVSRVAVGARVGAGGRLGGLALAADTLVFAHLAARAHGDCVRRWGGAALPARVRLGAASVADHSLASLAVTRVGPILHLVARDVVKIVAAEPVLNVASHSGELGCKCRQLLARLEAIWVCGRELEVHLIVVVAAGDLEVGLAVLIDAEDALIELLAGARFSALAAW
jgi:hypothetical protein